MRLEYWFFLGTVLLCFSLAEAGKAEVDDDDFAEFDDDFDEDLAFRKKEKSAKHKNGMSF